MQSTSTPRKSNKGAPAPGSTNKSTAATPKISATRSQSFGAKKETTAPAPKKKSSISQSSTAAPKKRNSSAEIKSSIPPARKSNTTGKKLSTSESKPDSKINTDSASRPKLDSSPKLESTASAGPSATETKAGVIAENLLSSKNIESNNVQESVTKEDCSKKQYVEHILKYDEDDLLGHDDPGEGKLLVHSGSGEIITKVDASGEKPNDIEKRESQKDYLKKLMSQVDFQEDGEADIGLSLIMT